MSGLEACVLDGEMPAATTGRSPFPGRSRRPGGSPLPGGPRPTTRPVGPTGARRLVKTGFDRLVAALALTALAPVMAAIAVAVRVTGPGPVLDRRLRIGRDGVEFTLLRFRTTRPGTQGRKVELVGDLVSDRHGPLLKIGRDPRMTPLGGWLRRRSLDELPQLINVLRGDMSLVGPRPVLPEEVERYGDEVRVRLMVRPGMTGLWQIDGGTDLSLEESVRLDLRYVENWSVMLDLRILWKTCSTVARGAGA
ncbi:sugar transferase [Sphaerimonospora sp. CA-214678]|uniref:sugar transferase n=1 Tax=Sphaerimonospora sp. CA-214678 TaxID=3240029 RepID=UPI003D902A52